MRKPVEGDLWRYGDVFAGRTRMLSRQASWGSGPKGCITKGRHYGFAKGAMTSQCAVPGSRCRVDELRTRSAAMADGRLEVRPRRAEAAVARRDILGREPSQRRRTFYGDFRHVVEKHGRRLVGTRPGERISGQPLRAIRGGTLCLRRRRQWERIEGDVLFSAPGRQMVHLSTRSRAAMQVKSRVRKLVVQASRSEKVPAGL